MFALAKYIYFVLSANILRDFKQREQIVRQYIKKTILNKPETLIFLRHLFLLM